MSDQTSPNIFLETFLESIQAKHPGSEGEATRAALREVHEQTKAAERHLVAMAIFTHIREICLGDLNFLRQNGLEATLRQSLEKDLQAGMDNFLTRNYSAICQNIALAGGLQLVPGGAPALPAPAIEVADEMSDDDKDTFRNETIFGRLLPVGQA